MSHRQLIILYSNISHDDMGCSSSSFGGRDREIIAPMCFFFDIRSPLTNPSEYLVMMNSMEIWGVTTAYIFCTLSGLFTPTMTLPLPPLWITESVQYLRRAATIHPDVDGFQHDSISRTATLKSTTSINFTNLCGDEDMICFQFVFAL